VWDSNYAGVWHLPNGTALTANDSTSNANNGTITNATAVTGKIDGAAYFGGSYGTNAKINKSSASGLPTGASSPFTIQGWQKSSSFNDLGIIFGFGDADAATAYVQRFLIKNNAHYWFWGGNVDWDTGITFDVDGNWHQWAVTFDGSKASFYRDGVLAAGPSTITGLQTAATIIRSGYASNWGDELNSSLDEERISATNRSADWIKTEYLNQSSPKTFYSLSAAGSARTRSASTSLLKSRGGVQFH
jgi:hypothetical protein